MHCSCIENNFTVAFISSIIYKSPVYSGSFHEVIFFQVNYFAFKAV